MAALRVFSRNIPYLRQQFSALLGNTSPVFVASFFSIVVYFHVLVSGDTSVGSDNRHCDVIYAWTQDTSLLFDIHVHGLAGYLAAVSVAVKQIMPDHLLIKTPLGKLTNRSLPLLILVAAIILWAVGALEGTYPCMWGSGTILSWIYLRFWQRHSSGTRGDMADNFSFDNFFPTVIQPLVRGALSPASRCLARLGVCTPAPRRVTLALSPRGVTISLPGVEPHDMERRRQIALKALSERLSKTSEQTRQKNLTTKVNMDTVRKMQASHVIPQFSTVEVPEASSSKPQSVPETTLVDISTEPSAPTTKTS
ncbi:unnamed protein product [Parnassius mnemosyne]|uniref:Transmembrane protein 115 n=1 Tax=Parnassius mnemosyne TaxID=213953 RepID=A0AAV1M856_9NEOP